MCLVLAVFHKFVQTLFHGWACKTNKLRYGFGHTTRAREHLRNVFFYHGLAAYLHSVNGVVDARKDQQDLQNEFRQVFLTLKILRL